MREIDTTKHRVNNSHVLAKFVGDMVVFIKRSYYHYNNKFELIRGEGKQSTLVPNMNIRLYPF